MKTNLIKIIIGTFTGGNGDIIFYDENKNVVAILKSNYPKDRVLHFKLTPNVEPINTPLLNVNNVLKDVLIKNGYEISEIINTNHPDCKFKFPS